MQRHLKLYRLPDATKTEGLRKLKITDVPEACKLLNKVSTRKIVRYIDHTKIIFSTNLCGKTKACHLL